MPDTKQEAYAHYVWATKQREPIIAPEWEPSLHALITALAEKAGCEVLAINGMPDHIHLLARESKTQLHAHVMQRVKGVSSQFISTQRHTDEGIASNWQTGYAVFTVSPSHVPRVTAYIQNQKQHHATGTLWPTCESNAIDGEINEHK